VSFVREAHDWEVDVFTSFFQVLDSTRVNRDRADCLSWVSSKKCVFRVKVLFWFLDVFWRNSVPLEEYVEVSGTPDGSFLYLVCSSR
jgi:hypothetical protein